MSKIPQIQITDSPLRLAEEQPTSSTERSLLPAPDEPQNEQTLASTTQSTEKRRPGAGPPLDEPLAGVYADVPRSLSAALDEAIKQLGAYRERPIKRELIAALLWKHVNPSQADNIVALDELLVAYAQARRPRA